MLMNRFGMMINMSIEILSNLVLVSGFGCLAYGYYLRKKEVYFHQLFSSIEKCQKFHLDYVDRIEHLPIDKPLLLFGTARALNPTEDKVIARTYIKHTAQQDRLWHFLFRDRFALATAGNQIVEVEPAPQGQKILAFNLHRVKHDNRHEERVIYHNEPVCAYGKLVKVGESRRRIYPQMLMGSKQEQVLGFLDQEILKLNSKGRMAVIGGTILFLSHLTYQLLWGKKANRSQNIAKVLDEIETQRK